MRTGIAAQLLQEDLFYSNSHYCKSLNREDNRNMKKVKWIKGLIQWTRKNPEYKARHTSPLLLQHLSTAAVLLLSSAQNSEHLQQCAKSSQHQLISRGPQRNCPGLHSAQTLDQYQCLPIPPLPCLWLSSHNHFSSLQLALHAVKVLCRQLLATNSTRAQGARSAAALI